MLKFKNTIKYSSEFYELAKKITEENPNISSVKMSDWEHIICLNATETELYDRIIEKCGVAQTDALDNILAYHPNIKNCAEYLRKLDRNITKAARKADIDILEEDGYYMIVDDGFCHHSEAEARYFYALEEYAIRLLRKIK